MLGYWEHLDLAQNIMLIGKEAVLRTWVSTLLVGVEFYFCLTTFPTSGSLQPTHILGTFMETREGPTAKFYFERTFLSSNIQQAAVGNALYPNSAIPPQRAVQISLN